MPKLPFFCPAGCGHLNQHIDDEYLISYGVCADCWFKLESIEGAKDMSLEEKIQKLKEIKERRNRV